MNVDFLSYIIELWRMKFLDRHNSKFKKSKVSEHNKG